MVPFFQVHRERLEVIPVNRYFSKRVYGIVQLSARGLSPKLAPPPQLLSGASQNCHGHSGINAGGCAGYYAPGSVIRAMSELSWSRSKMICLLSGETSKPVVE